MQVNLSSIASYSEEGAEDGLVHLTAQAQPMLLSEAIRKGASMMAKQERHIYFGAARHKGNLDAECSACALGAAIVGFTGYDVAYQMYKGRVHWVYDALMQITNQFLQKSVEHPVTHVSQDVFVVITDLNDAHDWTFDQIADWVAEIEAAVPHETK